MDLKTENLLSKFTVGVGHMMPDSPPPTRSFWIRLGAIIFFTISLMFLAALCPVIAPVTFSILFPAYLIFVLLGFKQLRAIEIAQAPDDLSEIISRKIELTVVMFLLGLLFSLFYGVMLPPVRVLIVPLVLLVSFYGWKSINR